MPVLMVTEQPNLDSNTYAAMIDGMMPLLRAATGFVSHAGGPSPSGGTRIVEIWESEEDSRRFFVENLKPQLPPGVVPATSYYALDIVFTV